MKNLNIAFFGTPTLAAQCLKCLCNKFNISLVVTKKDKVRGRGRKLTPTPVKLVALERGIPIVTPEKIDENFLEVLKKYSINTAVIVAYGQILPPKIVDFPEYGMFNLHPSLLPALRGASPIQSAIYYGLEETGITFQKVSYELDAGDIINQIKIKIEENWTAEDLLNEVIKISPEFLSESLELYLRGELKATPQNGEEATYCYPLKKEDALIDWKEDADIIVRKIRAFNIWPVCYSYLESKILRFFRACVYSKNSVLKDAGNEGLIVGIDKKSGILVRAGSGIVSLEELQLQGRKRMGYLDFINGYRNLSGKKLLTSPDL